MLEKINRKEMFENYPETLTVKQMREMLGGISKYAGLKLIYEGKIKATKIARIFRVSKSSVIEYMMSKDSCKHS